MTASSAAILRMVDQAAQAAGTRPAFGSWSSEATSRQAKDLRRPHSWRSTRAMRWRREAERLAATEEWGGAADLVAEMRSYAERADSPAAACLRRPHSRAGRRSRAAISSTRSGVSNGRPPASRRSVLPGNAALTELDLARGSSSAGNDDETERWAARAAATFEHLRDADGVAAARRPDRELG